VRIYCFRSADKTKLALNLGGDYAYNPSLLQTVQHVAYIVSTIFQHVINLQNLSQSAMMESRLDAFL